MRIHSFCVIGNQKIKTIYSDKAISQKSQDRLNRFRFASEIADGVVNSLSDQNDSLVLGITGSWGNGKSSFVNFVTDEIERINKVNKSNYIVFNFNPWYFSGQSDLQTTFLNQMILKLGDKTSKFKNLSSKLSSLLSYLNAIKYLNSGAGEAVTEFKKILDNIGEEKDLTSLKESVDEILKESNIKLYITIDDIDRLTPSEVTAIFQLVKLNANFSNTVFILAYDYNVVINSLQSKFGGNSKKYLEKIVQVDYTLPRISKSIIKTIAYERFTLIVNKFALSDSVFLQSIEAGNASFLRMIKNIRDINRIVNSILIRIGSIKDEVNFGDFVTLETIRIYDPEVYAYISEAKEYLTINNNSGSYKYERSNSTESINKHIESLCYASDSKYLIKSLFTTNKEAVYYSSYANQDSFRLNKISNPYYFDRYFNLNLSESEISEKDFEAFLSGDKNKIAETLDKLKVNEKVITFFVWLELKINYQFPKDKLATMLKESLRHLEKLHYNPSPFTFDEYRAIITTVSKISTSYLDSDQVRKFLLEYVSEDKAILSFAPTYICYTILYCNEQKNQDKLKYSHYWYRSFEGSDENVRTFISSIETTYKTLLWNLVTDFVDGGIDLNESEQEYMWLELYKYDKGNYEEFFIDYIKDDINLVHILKLSIQRAWIGGANGRGFQLSKDQLYPLINIENVKTRIYEMKRSNFSPEQQSTMRFFENSYDLGFPSKRFFTFETFEEVKEIGNR